MIIYKLDMIKELNKNGYSTYYIRKNKIFTEAQLQKLRKNEMLTQDAFNKLCKLTKLQPGDILEFVDNDNK